MRLAINKRRSSIRTVLLFSMAAFLLFSLTTSAQKRPQQPKPKTAAAKPKPTPTPSATDALGAPPPVPTLKKPPEQEVTPGDVISVMTTEVLLPVTVRDSNGALVKDL